MVGGFSVTSKRLMCLEYFQLKFSYLQGEWLHVACAAIKGE